MLTVRYVLFVSSPPITPALRFQILSDRSLSGVMFLVSSFRIASHQKGELAAEITGVPGAEISLAVLKAPGGHKIELLEYLAPKDRKQRRSSAVRRRIGPRRANGR